MYNSPIVLSDDDSEYEEEEEPSWFQFDQLESSYSGCISADFEQLANEIACERAFIRDDEISHLATNLQEIRFQADNSLLSRGKDFFLSRISRLRRLREKTGPYFLDEQALSDLSALNDVFASHNLSLILADQFNIRITVSSIRCLLPNQWLNDDVMNFTFALLQAEYPNVFMMKSFFYTKLMSRGYFYSGVSRWTKNVDIFARSKVIIPIHLGNHWCCACLNMDLKSIEYYDSMGGSNPTCVKALRQYLADEYRDKKGLPLHSIDRWSVITAQNRSIPRQMNCDDCGMFTCLFAEYLCEDLEFDFDQSHLPAFRKRAAIRIIREGRRNRHN